jgi:hypothetical protein
MALTFPTAESSPSFAGQAVLDATDMAAALAAAAGSGVTGCLVTAQGSPNMTVQVASGSVVVAGATTAVAAVASLTIGAASTNDRRDIVVVSNAGTVSVVAGAQCTTPAWLPSVGVLPPVKAAIPANSVLLAEIYVAAATTSIVAGNIVDKTALAAPFVGTSSGETIVVGLDLTGANAAANTVILNAAVTAAASGTVLRLPPGYIQFTTLTDTGNKVLTLRGSGYWTSVAAAFGDAQYSTLANFKGTVLISTATSGTAIAATGNGALSLEGLCLVGPGSGTSVGVQVAHRSAGTWTRGHWRDVGVFNFAKCVSWAAATSEADRLTVIGGGTACLEFVNAPNANVFNGLEVTASTVRGIDLSAGTLNMFNQSTIQGNLGTAVYVAAPGNQFISPYFENVGATFAVDIVAGGDYTGFYKPHWGTAADKVRIGANQCDIFVPQAVGGTITDNGSNSTFFGYFAANLTASTSAVNMDISTSTIYFAGRDPRINSGRKYFFETVGTGSYITRESTGAFTEIGGGGGCRVYQGSGLPSNSLGSNGAAVAHTLIYHKETGAWVATAA